MEPSHKFVISTIRWLHPTSTIQPSQALPLTFKKPALSCAKRPSARACSATVGLLAECYIACVRARGCNARKELPARHCFPKHRSPQSPALGIRRSYPRPATVDPYSKRAGQRHSHVPATLVLPTQFVRFVHDCEQPQFQPKGLRQPDQRRGVQVHARDPHMLEQETYQLHSVFDCSRKVWLLHNKSQVNAPLSFRFSRRLFRWTGKPRFGEQQNVIV
jgi:hypothetical protein